MPTDGGRYDVNLHQRLRQSVYWEEPGSEVRRCSWFYKGEGDRWYLPYDERIAATLEVMYMYILYSDKYFLLIRKRSTKSLVHPNYTYT